MKGFLPFFIVDNSNIRAFVLLSVYVYKIPPLSSAGGHRADNWNLAEPLKTCPLAVERRGDTLVLEFQAENGGVFAQSTLDITKGGKVEQFLEQCVDTSRYFAVKIQGGGGRTATIGFGFRDRERATDLREALQYYKKSIEREIESKNAPTLNFHIPKLAEGEKIHIGGKSGKTKVVKDSKKGGAVPLLGKKPPGGPVLLKKPPPSASSSTSPPPTSDETQSTSAPKQEEPVENLSIDMSAISMKEDSPPMGDPDPSEAAVFDGDDFEWQSALDPPPE